MNIREIIGLALLIFFLAPLAIFIIAEIADGIKSIIVDKRRMRFFAESADRLLKENKQLRAENEALKKYLKEPCSICKNNPPSVLCEESDLNCKECPANCKCKECIDGEGFKGFEWRGK